MIEIKPANDRGFLWGEFKDTYCEPCIIQESSIAEGSYIWLGPVGIAMHLNKETVADLLPHLQRFVKTGRL